MKTVVFEKDDEIHLGNWLDEYIEDLGVIGTDLPTNSTEMIENWRRITSSVGLQQFAKNEIRLIAPIVKPEKIICVGRNYSAHASEMGSAVEDLPVIFNKFPSALAGPDSKISIPSISHQVDYEAELVVVIGKRGKNIHLDDAYDHVFGYCCGNDVSARDWQKGKPGGQWLLGKTFDRFAPIGPFIATQDEIDPNELNICLTLNGESRQQANTRDLVFKIDYLISHLSKFCTLVPGDLLFTGTPAGVAAGRRPPEFLKPGDTTTVAIDGLGQLTNHFLATSELNFDE